MKQKLRTFLCGLAMGAADVVPGVSGGTIAYLTGIYDDLLNGIKAFDASFFRAFFKGRWKEAFGSIPWGFLLPLVCGVGVSIFSLAKLTLYLLHAWPEALWAFFFGLILASIILLMKGLSLRPGHWAVMALGTGTAWLVTGAGAVSSMPHSLPFIFLSGFIALCAMILPGISGSFILVVLGQYAYVLGAVVELKLAVLAVFATGGALGLMTFSRVLSACFQRFPLGTNAALIGVMAGCLRTVWPWHSEGLPALPPMDGMTLLAAVTCICGVALPLAIQRLARQK